MILRSLAGLAVVATLVLAGQVAPGKAAPAIPFEAEFKAICGDRWLDRAAQIKAESNFNPNAKSFDGGEGLGQATKVWPWYVRMGWVQPGTNPYQVVPAITGAHRHQSWAEAQVGGWRPGYCAYNAGVGSIQKAQKLARMAGLPAPQTESFLVTLPQVTKSASRWTINYDRNIRAIRAKYRAERGE